MKTATIGACLIFALAGSAALPIAASAQTHYPKATKKAKHVKKVVKTRVRTTSTAARPLMNTSAHPTAPSLAGASESSAARTYPGYDSKRNLDEASKASRPAPGYVDPTGRASGPGATTPTSPVVPPPVPSYMNPLSQPPAAVPSLTNQSPENQNSQTP